MSETPGTTQDDAPVERAEPTMLEQMGGIAGLVYSTLPILVFAVIASVAFVDARRDDIEARYAATGAPSSAARRTTRAR